MKKIYLIIITIGLFCSLSTFAQTKTEATQAVNQVIDGLHEAASQADLDAYLSSFTDTGVFMGTDDWERWSRPESLDKYVAERFAGGTGWTYKSVERNINFSTKHGKRSRRSILKLLLIEVRNDTH